MKCPIHETPKCEQGVDFRRGIDCRLCWLSVNDLVYQKRDFSKPQVFKKCKNFGDELTGLEIEKRGLTHLRIWHECDAGHGAQCGCDLTLICGVDCPDYMVEDDIEYKQAPSRRHLAFHIYPAKGNTVWRRAIDQLKNRWSLFNGYKAIAVMQEDHLESFDKVKDYCKGLDADVFPLQNDGGLREVKSWGPLWEKILSNANDQDFTFYGHAKGGTRENSPECMTHRWASLLYSLNLDYWPEIEKLLSKYPIVGAFKKNGYGFQRNEGRFHYSGTFYWLRVKDFKEINGKFSPPMVWYGTECWPGMVFDVSQGGCIFGESCQSKLELYSPEYWKTTVQPEMTKWLSTNPRRT